MSFFKEIIKKYNLDKKGFDVKFFASIIYNGWLIFGMGI